MVRARPLVRTLHNLALWSGVSARRARRLCRMRIVMMHGIGGSRVSEQAFAAQMGFLARELDVVPLSDLVRRLEGAGTVSGREVALTFDDGLRNHREVAAPVLERLGLPATFFVCPGLVDRGAWLWNHEVRARLARLGPDARQALALRVTRGRAKGPGAADLVAAMKRMVPARRAAAEAKVREATPGFEPTADEHARYDVLTWDDVRALDGGLFTVGSHSATHPILPTLDDASLETEIVGSRRALEARLDRPVDLFCYPNGDHSARVQALVETHYRAAVTTRAGLVEPGDPLHGLPRVGIAEDLATFAWRCHRP